MNSFWLRQSSDEEGGEKSIVHFLIKFAKVYVDSLCTTFFIIVNVHSLRRSSLRNYNEIKFLHKISNQTVMN